MLPHVVAHASTDGPLRCVAVVRGACAGAADSRSRAIAAALEKDVQALDRQVGDEVEFTQPGLRRGGASGRGVRDLDQRAEILGAPLEAEVGVGHDTEERTPGSLSGAIAGDGGAAAIGGGGVVADALIR